MYSNMLYVTEITAVLQLVTACSTLSCRAYASRQGTCAALEQAVVPLLALIQ